MRVGGVLVRLCGMLMGGFMVAIGMVLGCFVMCLGGMFMVLGCLLVCFVGHGSPR